MGLLEGKTAIITGASRGIGRAIAELFAKEKAHLALIGRTPEQKLTEYLDTLKKVAPKVQYYSLDVSNFKNVQQVVAEIIKQFGRVDVLVNNAGITRDNLLLRMSEEEWDKVIDVNLKSVFNMTKAVLRQMLKQRSGSIINMSSVVGLYGNAGQANYAASKGGIIAFTRSIAKEVGSRNIRANVIAPGFIQTDMTAALPDNVKQAWIEQIPMKRIGKPEDVAGTALFLASDLSLYITGQVIAVCGGLSL